MAKRAAGGRNLPGGFGFQGLQYLTTQSEGIRVRMRYMAVRAFAYLVLLAVFQLSAATVPGQYVVEMTTPSVSSQMLPRALSTRAARSRLGEAGAVAHRSRIRGEQRQLRTRLERRGARVLGAVETVGNLMFVELADADAQAQLAALPGVKRVTPMREFHRVMDRAVLSHKIADAWAQIGGDRAGAGIKIGIIDTGVQASHPAFQDTSMKAPDGFPRMNVEADRESTNGKVIVARSYVSLLARRDPDNSARDRVGHGTALASIVAGVRAAGPLATITGVAPKAWIGSYKVFGSPGVNDGATEAAIIRAIEDAVADGMDVINLSLGGDFAPRFDDDLEVQAIENASRAGVVVVVAAGNNGPGLNTLGSPGTAPSAITVGSVNNDRTFASNVGVPGLGNFVALPGGGPSPAAPLTAPVVDVASLGGDGLACDALPAESLKGAIAFIARGACTFEIKLDNAQRAGAMAALVFSTPASPNPVIMGVGAATLPAAMISHSDGLAVKEFLAPGGKIATLSFAPGPVPAPANRRSRFSAAGPNVDNGIKPDLVATGGDVYAAAQTLDRLGDMYTADGFVLVDGTSFSAPIVAGTVALIKSARPGLTVDQYRSLIINNTVDAYTERGELAGLQVTGSGSLDALASLNASVAAVPALLGFGSGGPNPRARRTLTLTNFGTAEDTFFIEASPRLGSAGPVAGAVTIAAGVTVETAVTWNGDGLAAGTHEGFLSVRSAASGKISRVPYWYSVASPNPASITVLAVETTGRAGGRLRDAISFRVLDSSGVNVAGARPEVSVLAGDGAVGLISSADSVYPGVFDVTLVLGPVRGINTFRIQAGEASVTVNITGE